MAHPCPSLPCVCAELLVLLRSSTHVLSSLHERPFHPSLPTPAVASSPGMRIPDLALFVLSTPCLLLWSPQEPLVQCQIPPGIMIQSNFPQPSRGTM